MMPALKGKPKSQFNMEQMFQSIIKLMLQSNVGLTSEPDVRPTLLILRRNNITIQRKTNIDT